MRQFPYRFNDQMWVELKLPTIGSHTVNLTPHQRPAANLTWSLPRLYWAHRNEEYRLQNMDFGSHKALTVLLNHNSSATRSTWTLHSKVLQHGPRMQVLEFSTNTVHLSAHEMMWRYLGNKVLKSCSLGFIWILHGIKVVVETCAACTSRFPIPTFCLHQVLYVLKVGSNVTCHGEWALAHTFM